MVKNLEKPDPICGKRPHLSLLTLDEHLCNQRVDILKIVTIFMGINRDVVNGKSKRHVKKIIEKIYEDVLEDADKS